MFVWRQLTNDDGVNFPLDLKSAVITVEYVDHLLQLRLLDQQVMFLLKVFLKKQNKTKKQ